MKVGVCCKKSFFSSQYCSVILTISTIIFWFESNQSLVVYLLTPTTYFCARIHALPVEEGRPKLSERRELLLGVHHQGMAWHHGA